MPYGQRRTQHGFLYNGSFTTLDQPRSTEAGGRGISGNNVVGYYLLNTDSSGLYHGFLYNGSFTKLDDPNTRINGTYVTGVSGNNAVGYYLDNNFLVNYFLYDGSTFTTLDAPGGHSFSPIVAVSGDSVVGSDLNGFNFQYQIGPFQSDYTLTANYSAPENHQLGAGTLINARAVSVQYRRQHLATASTWEVVGNATYANAGYVTPTVTVNDAIGNSLQTSDVSFDVYGASQTTLTEHLRRLRQQPNAAAGTSTGNVVLATFTDAIPAAGLLTKSRHVPGCAWHAITAGHSGGDYIVGEYTANYSVGITNFYHGFVYDSLTSTFTAFDPPGSTHTTVASLSGSIVVGQYENASDVYHGFLYNILTTTFTTFNFPTGSEWSGQYHGHLRQQRRGRFIRFTRNVYHGFLYNGTTYITLDDPDAVQSAYQGTHATDVSGSNVVGYYYDASSVEHGASITAPWDGVHRSSSMIRTQHRAAYQGTIAAGISGSNIVGNYADASNVRHGFLTQQDDVHHARFSEQFY